MDHVVNSTSKKEVVPTRESFTNVAHPMSKSDRPSYESLQQQLSESSLLIEDIVLKNYLSNLTDLELITLPDHMKQISNLRLFKITEMVYQNNEYSTYKFASVFNSIQNLNCSMFIVADSDGQKTEFYMGIRALDDARTTKSLKDTLRNALRGQFPGVKTTDLLDSAAADFLQSIPNGNIAAVSCVANNKNTEFTDNERFIQGLDKLVLAMQGQHYTAVVLAQSTPAAQLAEIRQAYENIYTQISPFANMQLSYGTNTALNISNALSQGTTTGTSHSINHSTQAGTSRTTSLTVNESETKTNTMAMVIKGVSMAVLGAAGIAASAPSGGASMVLAGAAAAGISAIHPKSTTKGTSTNESHSDSSSYSFGESDSTNESTSENYTQTNAITAGTTDNMQLTMQNKTLINTLERIDLQLKRIEECESLGMWECAAYFLSDSQETAEMAAGTYRALMKGDKSGIETSAINFWGRSHAQQLPMLHDYITNFIHPVFAYRSQLTELPVTASSLVSGNELAIQMGLPRKSVCGFPVIEHADFGREVVKYSQPLHHNNGFIIGHVFTMGSETNTQVRLDRDSLTMHTFVTGSTGTGKSNTVYEMVNQLRNVYAIPFLIIEPAKGEYKNVFGQFPDVSVYGTNPKKTEMLRINPFRFPPDIHVLEHLDRLVELFNVCWPMYAAMPAILKESIERSYVAVGWDLRLSENSKGNVYPNFSDVLEQIEHVIDESSYSSDSKGDYVGALCTRVRSLTNGLNSLIFTSDDLTDAELFNTNVIVDLSRIGSMETKSLIMGLLVMKLNEYRTTSNKTNSALKHITVLEEAHVLLKRTSTEQSNETANLIGKSVEMLAHSIAEMRTYGEGFIIADQSPGLLDMSVIRNTNTKIILRLPERSDRELVGYAANLHTEQIDELSKLERGVAAIYQNDWIEPVLVKVNKCDIHERAYNIKFYEEQIDIQKVWTHILSLLIQGRIQEKLDLNIDEIERGLRMLQLSSPNREFIEEQLLEYQTEGKLFLWNDNEFVKLSRRITGLLGVRTQVENYICTSADSAELTERLARLVHRYVPQASEAMTIAISQCFMKEVSVQKEELEVRERIYKQWIDDVKKSFVN